MSDRPVVVHLSRSFLAPTETFIGNQIRTLERYRPVVYTHHRLPNASYPFTDVHAVEEMLPTLHRLVDRASYRIARRMPGGSASILAAHVERERPRLLHMHYLVDARFFLEVKRLTGLPAVVSAYGYDVSAFPRQRAGYGLRYLRPIFDEIDRFIAMSNDMRRDLIKLGCPEHKIVVHYYGTDTDRFAYPERAYGEKPVVNILMCGTLEPKKAQDRVLQALHLWTQRSESRKPFQITFVGRGPLRGRLEELVREYGWHDRVRFLGHVPYHDPALVMEYQRADVFALPSVTIGGDKEGIPGTVVEAMASGLPVVSTYHAGIPEIVTSGVDGLLVEEPDLEGLSAALGLLIEDAALRERLGRAAAENSASRGRLLSRTPNLELIYDQVVEQASSKTSGASAAAWQSGDSRDAVQAGGG